MIDLTDNRFQTHTDLVFYVILENPTIVNESGCNGFAYHDVNCAKAGGGQAEFTRNNSNGCGNGIHHIGAIIPRGGDSSLPNRSPHPPTISSSVDEGSPHPSSSLAALCGGARHLGGLFFIGRGKDDPFFIWPNGV